MSNEKYGFIYIWYDRKHKRYYIGCHWGTENDGYICSSRMMRQAYRRRPDDFKRRIIKRIYERKKLLEEEYRYLSMIKNYELGKRYYNIQNNHFSHWSSEHNRRMTVGEKISASPDRAKKISEALTGIKRSEETKEKIRQVNLGKKHSEETIQKMKKSHNRDYNCPEFRKKMSIAAKNRSAEHRRKISENAKRLQAEGKIGMKGKKHSKETIQKMSQIFKQVL